MAELTVSDLHLTYGDNPILKGVSMELNRGEVVSLLGPSGSGKTTLLRSFADLWPFAAGFVRRPLTARSALHNVDGQAAG